MSKEFGLPILRKWVECPIVRQIVLTPPLPHFQEGCTVLCRSEVFLLLIYNYANECDYVDNVYM